MTKKIFHIAEMDCSEEVAILKKELMPLVGREEFLQFDVINSKLTVILPDNSNVLATDIISAVKETGMTAEPWTDKRSGGKTAAEKSYWQREKRRIMCYTSGLFLLSGFLYHAAGAGFQSAFISENSSVLSYPPFTMVLYFLSVITGGWFVAPKAIIALKKARPDMNLLMTLAVAGAVIIGELFEAAAVYFLFALSLLMESWSVRRARNAISALMDLSPQTARFKTQDNKIIEENIENVEVGSIIVVRPGEKIPLDGIITTGITTVDQSSITGESIPTEKEPGNEVFAGTINGEGAIEFRTTKPADDTTLARIIQMVEDAHSRKAPSEQWVEKFAYYYTPLMMALAAFIALFPTIVLGGEWSKWIYEALVILVIACPCALVISTPVSIVAALTSAARKGVLIKGGVFLETISKIQALAFDKTGTLTFGKPQVTDVITLDEHTEEGLLKCAASLETQTTHPFAYAIIEKAQEMNLEYDPAENLSAKQGKGAEGIISGRNYWIGNHRFLHEKNVEPEGFHEKVSSIEGAGNSLVLIGTDDHLCGMIVIRDQIRDGAKDIVRDLKQNGIDHVTMLTGDNGGIAGTVAADTGLDSYHYELLPEDKVKTVENLTKEYGNSAMVGDGVNDAPALAAASVGIAMGAAGTDAAIETADISLMSDDLSKLPWLIGFSKRTLRIIKQNITFALGIKFLFIILALSELATLWMAIAADMGATFLVIINALRLLDGKE
ncbi:heavy metal translocating P-type ATPase [candidate division KSB1 bacterium]